MRGDAKLARLRAVPLFAACPDRDLRWICRVADEVDVSPGTLLAQRGTPAREFMVILTGSAHSLWDGLRLDLLGPGSFVGEAELLTREPFPSDVVACAPTRLLALEARGFFALLDRVPCVGQRLLRDLALRLRRPDRPRLGPSRRLA